MSKFFCESQTFIQTDATWHRFGSLASRGARAFPRASLEYVLEKFPIIGWLPKYNYRWLPNDVIAGLTLGMMLVPQSLAYASIATIPVQYGLMSSWFPPLLYAFMGTSKGKTYRLPNIRPFLTSIRSFHRPYVAHWLADGRCCQGLDERWL